MCAGLPGSAVPEGATPSTPKLPVHAAISGPLQQDGWVDRLKTGDTDITAPQDRRIDTQFEAVGAYHRARIGPIGIRNGDPAGAYPKNRDRS